MIASIFFIFGQGMRFYSVDLTGHSIFLHGVSKSSRKWSEPKKQPGGAVASATCLADFVNTGKSCDSSTEAKESATPPMVDLPAT